MAHQGLASRPGSFGKTARLSQNHGNTSYENAWVVADVRIARGHRTAVGTRGATAGIRGGGVGVHVAGRRRAAARCRRGGAANRGVAMSERAAVSVGGGPSGLVVGREVEVG